MESADEDRRGEEERFFCLVVLQNVCREWSGRDQTRVESKREGVWRARAWGGEKRDRQITRAVTALRCPSRPAGLPPSLPPSLPASLLLGRNREENTLNVLPRRKTASRLELPEDDQFSDIRILRIRFLAHSDMRMYSNVDDSRIFGL